MVFVKWQMIEHEEDVPERNWACVALGGIVSVVKVFAGEVRCEN